MDDLPVRGIAFDSGARIAAGDIHEIQLIDYNIGDRNGFEQASRACRIRFHRGEYGAYTGAKVEKVRRAGGNDHV